tara:strand:- start:67 stop:627 length:561 start_codon:yes stop_codon:yes gene_type:complete
MLRICCLLVCSLLFGQTQQRKIWDASTIESIHLDFPWISSIAINTHGDPFIEAHYQTEGEYQDINLLKSSVVGVHFYLEEYQRPNWNNPGDKLSVHKVVANMISLTIPEGLYLSLFAKETELNCSGEYENLTIRFEHGAAVFDVKNPKGSIQSLSADLHFYGLASQQLPKNIKVNTTLGNIVVHPN